MARTKVDPRAEALADLGIAPEVDETPEPVEKDQKTLEGEAADAAFARSGARQPTYTDLAAHMLRFGPEGVLESALHLSEDQKEKLEEKAKGMKYNKKTKKWV